MSKVRFTELGGDAVESFNSKSQGRVELSWRNPPEHNLRDLRKNALIGQIQQYLLLWLFHCFHALLGDNVALNLEPWSKVKIDIRTDVCIRHFVDLFILLIYYLLVSSLPLLNYDHHNAQWRCLPFWCIGRIDNCCGPRQPWNTTDSY